MISHKAYVAGWINSSISDFFSAFPRTFDSMKYALLTCLDSDVNPASLLEKSAVLSSMSLVAKPLGSGLLLPTTRLLENDAYTEIFFGFDEIWFFPNDRAQPKPKDAWIVGPARISQETMDSLGAWMLTNSCSFGLGDGVGLNFIIKAAGLTKYVFGHSLEQPQHISEHAFASSDVAKQS